MIALGTLVKFKFAVTGEVMHGTFAGRAGSGIARGAKVKYIVRVDGKEWLVDLEDITLEDPK